MGTRIDHPGVQHGDKHVTTAKNKTILLATADFLKLMKSERIQTVKEKQ